MAEVDEDRLEELLRDPLRGRQLLSLDEAACGSELEHRPKRVVDLR